MNLNFLFFFFFRPKQFHAKCNKESIALESVVDAEDLNWLQEILKEFQEKTGSKVAEEILHDWPAAAKDFVKVHRPLIITACSYAIKPDQKSTKIFWG